MTWPDIVEVERKRRAVYIARVRTAWSKACQWEGIGYDTEFAVFSSNNPFVAAYETASLAYARYCRGPNV